MGDSDFLSLIEDASSLDPCLYQYFHNLLHRRTIIFNADVEEDIVECVWMPLREFEEDESNEPVTLILNSMGGSVSDGFFFANYLTHYKKKLNIIVCGYAASMAAVILAAGGKNPNITRYCYPSTYSLLHDGYVALSAQEAKTANDIMNYNNIVDTNIRQFILENTNITPEQYDAQARHQWFLSAEEMKELGMIDVIFGVDDND